MMITYRLYIIEEQQGITFTNRDNALKMKEKLEKEGYHVNMYEMVWETKI